MKTWDDFQTLLLYVVIGLIASIFVLGQCNLLALEDKTARSLWRERHPQPDHHFGDCGAAGQYFHRRYRPHQLLGLIVPHIARLLVGSNHKVLVPYSILLGAFTLLLADTVDVPLRHPMRLVLPSSCR